MASEDDYEEIADTQMAEARRLLGVLLAEKPNPVSLCALAGYLNCLLYHFTAAEESDLVDLVHTGMETDHTEVLPLLEAAGLHTECPCESCAAKRERLC